MRDVVRTVAAQPPEPLSIVDHARSHLQWCDISDASEGQYGLLALRLAKPV